MTPLPFDPEDPPEQPPADVRQPMLWRLAVRLHRDHDLDRTATATGPGSGPGLCRVCRAPWPCLARRTAERGLLAAFHDPPRPQRIRWFGVPGRDGEGGSGGDSGSPDRDPRWG